MFVTLSPKEDRLLAVLSLAGDVACERLADLNLRDVPTEAKRIASTSNSTARRATTWQQHSHSDTCRFSNTFCEWKDAPFICSTLGLGITRRTRCKITYFAYSHA